MARIRSIHPGLYTDEAYVSVSMAARVFLPGLWTEADDHGVFEWKPLALKMKIFPADNVDVDVLLAELVSANSIQKFTVGGKEYGVARNFMVWQRPKKPAYRYPFPDEMHSFAGYKPKSTEAVENQYPTGTEKSSQREEGGGRVEERKKKDTADAVPSKYVFEAGIIRLTKKDLDRWKTAFSYLDVPAELIGLQEWAAKQPQWFHAVSGALTKRNREIKNARDAPKLDANKSYWGNRKIPGIQ